MEQRRHSCCIKAASKSSVQGKAAIHGVCKAISTVMMIAAVFEAYNSKASQRSREASSLCTDHGPPQVDERSISQRLSHHHFRHRLSEDSPKCDALLGLPEQVLKVNFLRFWQPQLVRERGKQYQGPQLQQLRARRKRTAVEPALRGLQASRRGSFVL